MHTLAKKPSPTTCVRLDDHEDVTLARDASGEHYVIGFNPATLEVHWAEETASPSHEGKVYLRRLRRSSPQQFVRLRQAA